MNDLEFNPRELANSIMEAALQAVDPALAVKHYFASHPAIKAQIEATAGRLIVVGAGKAGTPMATAVTELFGSKIASGQVIVKHGYHHLAAGTTSPIKISEAGHPVPDDAGLEATQALTQLLAQTSEDDTVLCLISGGGSALLTLPAPDLTLEDLQRTTECLLAAGATINEFNTVRKHLSRVKGGGLAQLAAPATVHTLILSDVVADVLPVIASGPTVPDPSTFAEAWAIVEQYHVVDKLPTMVITRLKAGCTGDIPDTPKPNSPIFSRVTNTIVGSNRIAANAAVQTARQHGLTAHLLTTFVEGEAREVGKVLAGLAKGLSTGETGYSLPACLVLGGETTVTLQGDGKGGVIKSWPWPPQLP